MNSVRRQCSYLQISWLKSITGPHTKDSNNIVIFLFTLYKPVNIHESLYSEIFLLLSYCMSLKSFGFVWCMDKCTIVYILSACTTYKHYIVHCFPPACSLQSTTQYTCWITCCCAWSNNIYEDLKAFVVHICLMFGVSCFGFTVIAVHLEV